MKNVFKNFNIKKSPVLKKVAFCGLVGASLLGTVSCSDFLEKDPTFIVKDNYYTTVTEADIALTGIYSVLGNEYLYGSSLVYHLTMSDEAVWQRTSPLTGAEVYVFDSSDQNVRFVWKYLYEGIERANVFLSRMQNADINEARKNELVGEAKFLRAYYYFVLTTHFGEVPLKTLPTASVNDVDVPKAKLSDIYSFISSEMEAADAMVKPITAYNHAGRISKSAVRGVLARVYLKMAGAPLNGGRDYYVKAADWAGKLVNPQNGDYQHSLVSDYRQLFKDMAADRYNTNESIWEVEFSGNRTTDFEAGRHGNIGGVQMTNEKASTRGVSGYSYGFLLGTNKLLSTYGPGNDRRRDWNIADYAITITNDVETARPTRANAPFNRFVGKYHRDFEVVFDRHKNYTPINFPLLRYSDVLLMYAEAKANLGEYNLAKPEVQKVVNRALAIDSIGLSLVSDANLLPYIKRERYRELAYEGLRKFDLVRWDEFQTTMANLASSINNYAPTGQKYTSFGPGNVTSRNNLLPIPIDELSLNKAITQNVGW